MMPSNLFSQCTKPGILHRNRNSIFVLGEEGIARFNLQTHLLRQADTIDDWTQDLANKLAHVLCGGKLSAPQFVTEQYLLDLEHEVFLGLCGEQQTHARIEATLQRGKK